MGSFKWGHPRVPALIRSISIHVCIRTRPHLQKYMRTAGDERLARAGGAVEEDAARGLDAEGLEERGVAEGQLDHLADLGHLFLFGFGFGFGRWGGWWVVGGRWVRIVVVRSMQ